MESQDEHEVEAHSESSTSEQNMGGRGGHQISIDPSKSLKEQDVRCVERSSKQSKEMLAQSGDMLNTTTRLK